MQIDGVDPNEEKKKRGLSKHPNLNAAASFHSSQSQGRLVLCVTCGGGGRGLALLVEFEEAGFFYHHGDGAGVAVGIFQSGQSSFLRRLGRVPFSVNHKVSMSFRRTTEFWLLDG